MMLRDGSCADPAWYPDVRTQQGRLPSTSERKRRMWAPEHAGHDIDGMLREHGGRCHALAQAKTQSQRSRL